MVLALTTLLMLLLPIRLLANNKNSYSVPHVKSWTVKERKLDDTDSSVHPESEIRGRYRNIKPRTGDTRDRFDSADSLFDLSVEKFKISFKFD